MDGNTEERLSIRAAITGDKRVESGLGAMAAAAKEAAKDRKSRITYDDEGTLARVTRDAKGFQRTMSGISRTVSGGARLMRGAFMGLVGVPAIFAAITIAITALPGLLSAATGGVVALGVAITALAAGGIALLGGLNGVFAAIGAGRDQMASGVTAAQQYAANLRAVQQASLAVTQAQQDAERATRDLAAAQERFNDAPKEAADAITEARLRAAQASLTERDAVLRLKQAQENLAELQKNIGRSTLQVTKQTDAFTGKIVESVTKSAEAIKATDIESAQNAVKQAELAILLARRDSAEAQDDLNEKVADGIENSDIYQDALWALRDAQNRVADSTQNIADAQERLTEAQKTAAGPVNAYAAAMAKLTPEGRNFVNFILTRFNPALMTIRDSIQRNLLPGIQTGLQVIVDNVDGVSSAFGRLGGSVGNSFASFMQYWGRPENKGVLAALVDGLAGPNGSIEKIGKALEPLSSVLAQVITAATPLFNTLMTEFGDWLTSIDQNLKNGGMGDLESWFTSLAGPITNTFGLLGDFAQALTPLTGENGAFNQLITGLRKDFIPAFAELVQAVSDSDLAQGMVGVLTGVTNVLTGLVKLNDATGNGLLYATLGIIASAAFANGISGLVTLLGGAGSLLGLGSVGSAAGGAAAGAGGRGAGGLGGIVGGLGKAGLVGLIASAVVASIGQTLGSTNAFAEGMRNGTLGGGTRGADGKFVYDDATNRAGGQALAYAMVPITGIIQTALDIFFPALGEEFRTFITDIGAEWFSSITSVSQDIGTNWASFVSGAQTNWNVFWTNWNMGWSTIETEWGNFWRDTSNNWNGFWANWNAGWSTINTQWGNFWRDVESNWTSVTTEWGNFWQDVNTNWSNITREWGNFWRDIGTGWTNFWNGLFGRRADGGTVTGKGYRHAAGGDTVPGNRGAYRDRVPYLLAPGEEVISNRHGQADRHRDLLKRINSGQNVGSYDNYSKRDIEAMLNRVMREAKPDVKVEAKIEDKTTPDELGKALAWRLR